MRRSGALCREAGPGPAERLLEDHDRWVERGGVGRGPRGLPALEPQVSAPPAPLAGRGACKAAAGAVAGRRCCDRGPCTAAGAPGAGQLTASWRPTKAPMDPASARLSGRAAWRGGCSGVQKWNCCGGGREEQPGLSNRVPAQYKR
jgi:hypothetical protein